jgi:hypothetical protein
MLLLDIEGRPRRPRPCQYLAACYGHMGRIDEARAIVARPHTVTSQVVPNELPLRNPEHRELLLVGSAARYGRSGMTATRVSPRSSPHVRRSALKCMGNTGRANPERRLPPPTRTYKPNRCWVRNGAMTGRLR